MQSTTILFHSLIISLGFWWVCYPTQITFSTVLRSLIAGFVMGFAGLWSVMYFTHGNLLQHLSALPMAGLLGATLMLWIQEHKHFAEKSGRDHTFLMTLSFMFFMSPMTGGLRLIAIVMALPAVAVLGYYVFKKDFGSKQRSVLTVWTVLMSMVMGIYSLGTSSEIFAPMNKTALTLSNIPYFWSVALQAGGLMSLALGIVPMMDWIQKKYSNEVQSDDDDKKEDTFSTKRAIALFIFHVGPMILNWKFHFISHEAMLGFALAWSPFASTQLANSMEPEPPSKIFGWDEDSTQAS